MTARGYCTWSYSVDTTTSHLFQQRYPPNHDHLSTTLLSFFFPSQFTLFILSILVDCFRFFEFPFASASTSHLENIRLATTTVHVPDRLTCDELTCENQSSTVTDLEKKLHAFMSRMARPGSTWCTLLFISFVTHAKRGQSFLSDAFPMRLKRCLTGCSAARYTT